MESKMGDSFQWRGMDFLVHRKKIKKIYLRIDPYTSHVHISLPHGTKDDVISRILSERVDWLEAHVAQTRKRLKSNAHNYEGGEIHYLWGKPYRLFVKFIPKDGSKKEEKAFVKGDYIVMYVLPQSDAEKRANLMEALYREELESAIPVPLGTCEQVVGKTCSTWVLRRMKSRWGSCNVETGRICFNTQLAKYDKLALTYIMIHELTHLHEANHGKRFHALMDQFMPNWKEARQLLREPLQGKV